MDDDPPVLNIQRIFTSNDIRNHSQHMIYTLVIDLQAWDASDLCKVIVIKGSGEKAFCAGGDVRHIVELAQSGKHSDGMSFFAEEYRLNHMIATLKTPFVAILNGITSKRKLLVFPLVGAN